MKSVLPIDQVSRPHKMHANGWQMAKKNINHQMPNTVTPTKKASKTTPHHINPPTKIEQELIKKYCRNRLNVSMVSVMAKLLNANS